MLVIADTSPINYLVLIGEEQLLQLLYKQIFLPSAVHRELLHHGASQIVRTWAEQPPTWVTVLEPSLQTMPALNHLGSGEREAILVALLQTEKTLLLIDELKGRSAAASLGLDFTGTLGVLNEGAAEGLVDLPMALNRLAETSFRVLPALLKKLLDQDRLRGKPGKA